jgi:hypothetical protein
VVFNGEFACLGFLFSCYSWWICGVDWFGRLCDNIVNSDYKEWNFVQHDASFNVWRKDKHFKLVCSFMIIFQVLVYILDIG